MPQEHTLLSSDEDFFTAGASPSSSAVRDLVRGGFRGISIDAPFSVDTSVRDRLPVVGIFTRAGGSGTRFSDNAMLVLVDADGGGMQVVQAFEPPEGDEDDGGPSGPAGGVATDRFALDVRTAVEGLSWGSASWRVHVVYDGWVSNGITVTLDGASAASSLPLPKPIDALPDAVEPEQGDALTLSGPSSATTQPGDTVALTGAVPGSGDRARVGILGVGPAPTPFYGSLDVPLKDGRGAFSVNLLGDNPLPKAPGTWHVYAFSGEHVAGPVTIELTPGSKPW